MNLAKASGVYAIAPTPFTPDGAVDFDSIDRMMDFYLALRRHRPDRARRDGRGAETRRLGVDRRRQARDRPRGRAADHRRRFGAGLCRDARAGA